MRLYISFLYMILAGVSFSVSSCSPRVYWPQSHDHRGARSAPRGSASIDVLEEGRDYQGWSPAPVKCQQQFPFRVTKK